MQLKNLLTTLLITLATAAPAPAPAAEVEPALEARQSVVRVQFEIERQTTFIQREIRAGGGVFNRNGPLFSALIVSGPSNARCQAFNGNTAVGAAIVPNRQVNYNGAFVTQVRC
ncbi:hypothetical protein QC762_0077320 [Podospora pseudocomata]|uniref:Uncharacterized protein n=3 Tax=Podospora TaxID=5144 RepID=A0ABR0H8D4_9PEZI|nr:hypothetical protein QC762_0077320 [Podospora pseudocomata]KAK4664133.1 hypothetical protein QC763_0082740 [Podospora pseudopauciseta]KAK4675276.1 hypothetical protein QC764_0076310 [Podospora pseudoanserina]